MTIRDKNYFGYVCNTFGTIYLRLRISFKNHIENNGSYSNILHKAAFSHSFCKMGQF